MTKLSDEDCEHHLLIFLVNPQYYVCPICKKIFAVMLEEEHGE